MFVFLVKGCKQDISCRKYIFPIRKKDVSNFLNCFDVNATFRHKVTFAIILSYTKIIKLGLFT